jgi:hypothetical protein
MALHLIYSQCEARPWRATARWRVAAAARGRRATARLTARHSLLNRYSATMKEVLYGKGSRDRTISPTM